MSADVVDGEDLGVVEGGDGSGFELEPAKADGVGGDVVGEDLDRDVAAEAGIPRAVNRPHAAGPSSSPISYGPDGFLQARAWLTPV